MKGNASTHIYTEQGRANHERIFGKKSVNPAEDDALGGTLLHGIDNAGSVESEKEVGDEQVTVMDVDEP